MKINKFGKALARSVIEVPFPDRTLLLQMVLFYWGQPELELGGAKTVRVMLTLSAIGWGDLGRPRGNIHDTYVESKFPTISIYVQIFSEHN